MNKPRRTARLLGLSSPILAGSLLLAGCAQDTSSTFPSLLPRAIEKRSDAEPVVEVPVAAPDPALDARIATTQAAMTSGKRDFAMAAARAESATRAARGAAVGSDRWLDAQTALAELDVFRATSSGLVTDLDELLVARAADGKPPYPALDTARAAAQAELDAETAVIGRLQAAMPAA